MNSAIWPTYPYLVCIHVWINTVTYSHTLCLIPLSLASVTYQIMKHTLLFLTFTRLCFVNDCLLLDDKLTLNAECPELEEELVKCQKRNVELEEEIRILKVRYLTVFGKYIFSCKSNIIERYRGISIMKFKKRCSVSGA